MKNWYRTVDDVLRSPWAAQTQTPPVSTDRVLQSTKLENCIYSDLRSEDDMLTEIEQAAAQKLPCFPALSQDVFQSFYSLLPKRTDPAKLSASARKFSAKILDHMVQEADFRTLKAICEGRELPAYEAATEFISKISDHLDELLSEIGRRGNALSTLQKLTDAQTKAQKELAGLLDRLKSSKERNLTLESSVIEAANSLERKHRQVEAVEKLIDTSSAQHKAEIRAAVASASQATAQKAEEVQSIFAAWSDEPGNLERNTVNLELLEAVRKSQTLQSVAKYLGRFREIIAKGRRNGYAFGRGESYSLELGNNLSRALSSEFSMLASPQTAPLFLKRYQQKQLKQYRRREPIRKGMGDIICCLDESNSTCGDPAAWGKAVALALLDIAAGRGRKFALIHFASYESCQVDVFLPGKYSAADKMAAAEVFLSGGTNFERPLQEAIRLMDEQEFENADIVFLTDGQCALSEEFASQLKAQQTARHFTVTGILLDTNPPGMEFSLHPFCQNVYRTSELLGDEIMHKLMNSQN